MGARASRLLLFLLALGGACGVPTASSFAADPPPLVSKYKTNAALATAPQVIWFEDASETSVASLLRRYDTVTYPYGVSIVDVTSALNKRHRAVRLIAGAGHHTADLYKSFGAGYDEVYIRYYANYETNGPWSHTGLWFGGYNPPLKWPYPHAGVRPTGYDRFLIALEPIWSFSGEALDFYAYWRGMHTYEPQVAHPLYWGNTLIHDARFLPEVNRWNCYEVHLQLNPQMTSSQGAVLEVWRNDYLEKEFSDAGPYGYWIADKFCPADATGTECTRYSYEYKQKVLLDQRWRLTPALKINNIWLLNYNTAAKTSTLLVTDVVVATQRVGCAVDW